MPDVEFQGILMGDAFYSNDQVGINIHAPQEVNDAMGVLWRPTDPPIIVQRESDGTKALVYLPAEAAQ
jgi:hypothetical protein